MASGPPTYDKDNMNIMTRNGTALAVALASGASVTDAAAAAGIGRTTAHRRLRDPAFLEELAQVRQQMLAEGTSRLAEAMVSAVTVLETIAADETVSPAVRVAAAGRLLEGGLRVRGQDAEVEPDVVEGTALDLRTMTPQQLAHLRARALAMLDMPERITPASGERTP